MESKGSLGFASAKRSLAPLPTPEPSIADAVSSVVLKPFSEARRLLFLTGRLEASHVLNPLSAARETLQEFDSHQGSTAERLIVLTEKLEIMGVRNPLSVARTCADRARFEDSEVETRMTLESSSTGTLMNPEQPEEIELPPASNNRHKESKRPTTEDVVESSLHAPGRFAELKKETISERKQAPSGHPNLIVFSEETVSEMTQAPSRYPSQIEFTGETVSEITKAEASAAGKVEREFEGIHQRLGLSSRDAKRLIAVSDLRNSVGNNDKDATIDVSQDPSETNSFIQFKEEVQALEQRLADLKRRSGLSSTTTEKTKVAHMTENDPGSPDFERPTRPQGDTKSAHPAEHVEVGEAPKSDEQTSHDEIQVSC